MLQNEATCGISSLVIGEFYKGAHLLADGKKRRAILGWISEVAAQFEDKIYPVDLTVSKRWGELCGDGERVSGDRLQVLDSLIAATALTHGLTIVTRNVADFPTEVDTFNPWK